MPLFKTDRTGGPMWGELLSREEADFRLKEVEPFMKGEDCYYDDDPTRHEEVDGFGIPY